MSVEKIKKAIRKWSEVRNEPEEAISFLKQGSCFKIEKDQYERWKTKKPENVYAYVGIMKKELKFILVDSESDKDFDNCEDYIFVEDYLPGLNLSEENMLNKAVDGNITVLEALKRNMNWVLLMQSWIENKSKTSDGVFKAFIIPFKSLISQFEGTKLAESVVVIGLGTNNLADLILWNHSKTLTNEKMFVKNGDDPAPVDNLVYPCPPFSGPSQD